MGVRLGLGEEANEFLIVLMVEGRAGWKSESGGGGEVGLMK